MKTSKQLQIIIIILLTFTVHFVLDKLYFKVVRTWINAYVDQMGISQIIAYALSLLPLIAGAYMLHKTYKKTVESFGFDQSFFKGLVFCFICTLPMLLGYVIVFDFNTQIKLNDILIYVVAAGFFEEVIFRGFLFGQLYRYTKLGFIPAALLGSLIFGLMHLYQSDDPMTMLGIFGITFVGSLFFGWAYAEWKFNIWVPIFLHLMMNLYFELFSAGDNALGGVYMNIFRLVTIALVIGLTIYYKRKNKLPFEVTKKSWWMKKVIAPI